MSPSFTRSHCWWLPIPHEKDDQSRWRICSVLSKISHWCQLENLSTADAQTALRVFHIAFNTYSNSYILKNIRVCIPGRGFPPSHICRDRWIYSTWKWASKSTFKVDGWKTSSMHTVLLPKEDSRFHPMHFSMEKLAGLKLVVTKYEVRFSWFFTWEVLNGIRKIISNCRCVIIDRSLSLSKEEHKINSKLNCSSNFLFLW